MYYRVYKCIYFWSKVGIHSGRVVSISVSRQRTQGPQGSIPLLLEYAHVLPVLMVVLASSHGLKTLICRNVKVNSCLSVYVSYPTSYLKAVDTDSTPLQPMKNMCYKIEE